MSSDLSDDLAAHLTRYDSSPGTLRRHDAAEAIDFLLQPERLTALLEMAVERGSAESERLVLSEKTVYAIKQGEQSG